MRNTCMKLTDELYRLLEDEKRKKLEEAGLEADGASRMADEDSENQMTEEEVFELIRQFLMARNLSEAEREKQIREIMERSNRNEGDVTSMIEMEQLRKDAESRQQRPEEMAPETRMEKPFSYNEKKEEGGGRYGNQPDERYGKPQQNEFEKMAGMGQNEFDKINKTGQSEFDRINNSQSSEYNKILGKDEKEKSPRQY